MFWVDRRVRRVESQSEDWKITDVADACRNRDAGQYRRMPGKNPPAASLAVAARSATESLQPACREVLSPLRFIDSRIVNKRLRTLAPEKPGFTLMRWQGKTQ